MDYTIPIQLNNSVEMEKVFMPTDQLTTNDEFVFTFFIFKKLIIQQTPNIKRTNSTMITFKTII